VHNYLQFVEQDRISAVSAIQASSVVLRSSLRRTQRLIDMSNPDLGHYPMYELEIDGFIIADLTSNKKLIRCKETGEAGVFDRDAFYNRGGLSVGEFYAKNF